MDTLESKYGIYPPKPDAWKRFDEETPPDGIVWVKDEGWDDFESEIKGAVKGHFSLEPDLSHSKYNLWQPVVYVDKSKNAQPESGAPAYPYRKGDWIVSKERAILVSMVGYFMRQDGTTRVWDIVNKETYLLDCPYETFISLLTQ